MEFIDGVPETPSDYQNEMNHSIYEVEEPETPSQKKHLSPSAILKKLSPMRLSPKNKANLPDVSSTLSNAKSKVEVQMKQLWIASIFYQNISTQKMSSSRTHRAIHVSGQILGSSLGLLALLAVYTVLGALVFMALEGPHEQHLIRKLSQRKIDIMDRMWNHTQTISNRSEWQRLVSKDLNDYRAYIESSYQEGIDPSKKNWDFFGAIFFCITVYTTIGYGHTTPHTDGGRVMCIIYAVIGIPLCLIVLAKVGRFFSRVLNTLWVWTYYRITALMNRYKKTRAFSEKFKAHEQFKPPDKYNATSSQASKTSTPTIANQNEARLANGGTSSDSLDSNQYTLWKIYQRCDSEFNFPVTLAILIVFMYIFTGAFIYRVWEQWTYLESFYFIFISVSTIGFGDVMPHHPKFFLIVYFYIFIGLSVVSMVINVLMNYIVNQIRQAQKQLDKMASGGMKDVHTVSGSVNSLEPSHDVKVKMLSQQAGSKFKKNLELRKSKINNSSQVGNESKKHNQAVIVSHSDDEIVVKL